MPQNLKDRDFVTTARHIVEQAIGQQMNGEPLTDPNAGKDPKAVSRGKLGGLKGGKARASKLSPRRRKQIAKKAAESRWT